MLSLLNWNIIIMIFCSLTTSCATSAPVVSREVQNSQVAVKSEDPMKSFDHAEDYLKEAQLLFESHNYRGAQQYIEEAIKLDPVNQAAYLLSGVIYMKLGQGHQAERAFETVISLNNNSQDALNAKAWLDRKRRPLKVAILPIAISISTNINPSLSSETREDQLKRNIRKIYYETIKMFLTSSGYYDVADYTSMKGTTYNQLARDGVKIVIDNITINTNIKELEASAGSNVARGLLSLATLGLSEAVVIQPLTEASRKIDINISMRLDLYHAKDNVKVQHIDKSQIFYNVPYSETEINITDKLRNMFDAIALEIHQALL